MHRRLPLLALTLVLILTATRAHAWGTKEHVLLTRLAVMRILEDPTAPEGLKTWLRTVTPDLKASLDEEKEFFLKAKLGAEPKGLIGLSYWAIEPDIRANGDKKTKVAPFDQPERLLHFIDLEYLSTEPDKRVYKHDLSSLPDVTQAPRDMSDARYKEAGMLPFRVEQCYQNLVAAFKAGKLGTPRDPKDEESALRWAGFLAHYVEDNTQPQHATQDYKSGAYFADKRNSPNVHSEVEWKMNDDEKKDYPQLRADFWTAFAAALPEAKDPTTSDDLFTSTLELSAYSYKQLPLIGLAAMHATDQKGTPEKPEGRAGAFDTEKFFRFESDVTGAKQSVYQMKAKQQAIAVVRVAKLFRRAWDEAHK